ncbi:MAG: glycosyltransferase family 39 protein [Chloroflexota bacterium]
MNRALLGTVVVTSAVAAAFRLPLLDGIPGGLFIDEASRGYDAYALLRTGADQYGVRWPIFPEGLDDYTPALYTLLVIPAVATLGLTELAVRLPAALAGTITVALCTVLAHRWFGSTAGLVSGLLLAISPWHILPSRTGTEWVLLPALVTAGVLLLDLARTRPPLLLAAGAAMATALYSYAFARLLVPLLLAGWVVAEWRTVRRSPVFGLSGLGIVLAAAGPLVAFSATEAGQARARTVIPIERLGIPGLVPYALANLFSYFDPRFLLLGTEPTFHHHVAGQGPVLPIVFALALVGLVWATRSRSVAAGFTIFWLAAAPLASALHRESPSSALLLGAIPSWHLLGGAGGAALLAWTRGWCRTAVAVAIVGGLLLSGASSARELFFRYPVYSAPDWMHGARAAVANAESRRASYDGVLVSDRLAGVHLLVLFYTRADPSTYQANPIHVRQPNVRSRGGFGGYTFGRLEDLLGRPGRFLVWATAEDLPRITNRVRVLDEIHYPDGTLAHAIAETSQP